MQTPEEAVDGARGEIVGAHEAVQLVLDRGAEGGVVQILARQADDAGRVGDLPVEVAHEQRGEQLSVGEIAGAAEDDEIEGIDGDDPARHEITPVRSGAQMRRAVRHGQACREMPGDMRGANGRPEPV